MKALTAPPAFRGAGTRRRTPLLSALAGLAILIAGTIATVAPASAATPATTTYGTSYYLDSYVDGEGMFQWTISSSVKTLTGNMFLSCNSPATSAKVAIDVEDTSGTWRLGTWHTISVCNGTTVEWVGLTWTESTPIRAWEVKVQRSGGGVASGAVVTVS